MFDSVPVAACSHINPGRAFGIVRSTYRTAFLNVLPERPLPAPPDGSQVVACPYAVVGRNRLMRDTNGILKVEVFAIVLIHEVSSPGQRWARQVPTSLAGLTALVFPCPIWAPPDPRGCGG